MIEECHNINSLNCGVNRETIQWPEHIKTIFDSNINELTEIQKVSFKNLLLQLSDRDLMITTIYVQHTVLFCSG
jgi:hypothetical protein